MVHLVTFIQTMQDADSRVDGNLLWSFVVLAHKESIEETTFQPLQSRNTLGKSPVDRNCRGRGSLKSDVLSILANIFWKVFMEVRFEGSHEDLFGLGLYVIYHFEDSETLLLKVS